MRSTLASSLALVVLMGVSADPYGGVEEARKRLESEDIPGALASAKRVLAVDKRNLEASLIAAQAEIRLQAYAAAADRLEATRKFAPTSRERETLLAAAAFLDAERSPSISIDAARARRREAAYAAQTASQSGMGSPSLRAIRTTALRKLGDYAGARRAAEEWAATEDGIEPKEALAEIDAAVARWAELDAKAPVPPRGAVTALPAREQRLLRDFGRQPAGTYAGEIGALLDLESDRTRRAQLIVLEIAESSIGRAELAALEALEAGFLDEKAFQQVIGAVRRRDPSEPADNALRLDGASEPERITKTPSHPPPPGTHVGAEVLYRIEPDGHVGVAVFLGSPPPEVRQHGIEYTRMSSFRPATRAGRPVAVPRYDPIYVGTYSETMFGSAGPGP